MSSFSEIKLDKRQKYKVYAVEYIAENPWGITDIAEDKHRLRWTLAKGPEEAGNLILRFQPDAEIINTLCIRNKRLAKVLEMRYIEKS